MTVFRLDHVNIRTARLADSIAFYGQILGMEVRVPPMADDLSKGAYMHDAAGAPVVHLVGTNKVTDAPDPVRGQAQRGLVDHFALRCDDPEPILARLKDSGLAFDVMDVPEIASRLIFVRDPNGVLVELGFPLHPDTPA